MKDIKVVFTSDLHLGLKTDEIDRTSEIILVCKQVIKHCKILIDTEKYRVILVIGGDIFNTNYPGESLITQFLTILNYIRKYEIETYIMVGNHDSVPDPNRSSCLSFIRKLGVAYPTIKLVDDIKFLKIGSNDTGPIYFTFLPHITKALICKKIEDGKYDGEINTKTYIDDKCFKIMKKFGSSEITHYVFSHLNVIGAHPGSEENLLKKSEVFLPDAFTKTQIKGLKFYSKPTIIQGHLHSQNMIENIHIIGSPIYCSFGESGKKYFAEISINSCLGVKDEIKLIPTKCRDFKQLELDMVGETNDFFNIKAVKEFLNNIKSYNNPVVKFDITIDPGSNTYDWNEIRKKITTDDIYVKPITPRVVIKRTVRSIDQRIELPVKDKIKVYLRKNLRSDKLKAKRVYKKSLKYLEAN